MCDARYFRAIMVGWHSMDANESWLDGLDWTDVEVGSHAPHKACLSLSCTNSHSPLL